MVEFDGERGTRRRYDAAWLWRAEGGVDITSDAKFGGPGMAAVASTKDRERDSGTSRARPQSASTVQSALPD